MHIARYYEKKSGFAFVVLGFCKTFSDIQFELDLFETHTGIKIGYPITLEEVAEYDYQGMIVVKFKMHPVEALIDKKGGEWEILTKDNVKYLTPKKYRNV